MKRSAACLFACLLALLLAACAGAESAPAAEPETIVEPAWTVAPVRTAEPASTAAPEAVQEAAPEDAPETDAAQDEIFVTVVLTPENVSDYIEFLPYRIEYLDAFGNPSGSCDCGVATASRVFDEGLVYWESRDAALEILFPDGYSRSFGRAARNYSIYTAGSHSEVSSAKSTVTADLFAAVIYGFGGAKADRGLDFHPEALRFGNAKGTVTFVRAEYVAEISNAGGRTVTLVNGESRCTGLWCNGVDWPENIMF